MNAEFLAVRIDEAHPSGNGWMMAGRECRPSTRYWTIMSGFLQPPRLPSTWTLST
jgi:hypothetical protein